MANERSGTDADNARLGVDDPSDSVVSETEGDNARLGVDDPSDSAVSEQETATPAGTDTLSDPTEPAEPTPSVAFQRQQRRVGIAGALLAGGALAVALYQRFPDTSVLLPVVGGVLGTVVVLWFVRKSVFVTDGTATE